MDKGQKSTNSFFLISFLPALAYWYLEENYPVKVAITGGLLLSILEISLEKIFTKHVHKISVFNFFLILFLGCLSLLGDDGIWFKLQPFFTGVFMGSYLLIKVLKGKGLMYEMMEAFNHDLPPLPVWRPLEFHLSLLFLGYGLFMGVVALFFSTSQWLFYKTAGFYISFIVFMGIEFYFLRRRLKKYLLQKQIAKKF